MYSESEDFRNVWSLAHDWAGFDADKTDVNHLPKHVYLNLQRLSAAILNRSLKAQTKKVQIFIDDSVFTLIFFDLKTFIKLLLCKWGHSIDNNYLASIYVKRVHFIEWCEKERLPYNDFWILTQVTANYKINNRPKNELEDKAVCRAIAMTYWDIDPNIHPAHMATAKAIRKYGNGDQYEINTIKEWISDLDPQLKQRKTGRPKEISYKIKLETGTLPHLNSE
jgi:hypothetical protein